MDSVQDKSGPALDQKKSRRLPADASEVLQGVLEVIISRHGPEEGIGALAAYLRRHIPFEKLILYLSDARRATRVPLVVVENARVRPGDISRSFPNPPRKWSQAHVIDSDGMFILDNSLHSMEDGSLTDMFDDRQSMLGMIVLHVSAYTVTMTLTASRPDQFRPEDADLLRMLKNPLEFLARRFAGSLQGTPLMLASDDAPSASSLELLKACGGLRHALRLLEGVASTDMTVLLHGETGVGKELFADALHSLSARSQAPFVRVNCAAMTETLLDDAFFGHEQGAFTGASRTSMGFFEQANTGTLFLDEVGELSPAAQARLLRVLESRDLQRVGGHRRILVDVRIVAATHRNLRAMVEAGTFREDLWYRLSVFPLEIPPLRERREDITALTVLFYRRAARQFRSLTPPALTERYMASLLPLPWKGNVRELRNRVEGDMVRASLAGLPGMEPLPADPGPASADREEAARPGSSRPDRRGTLDELTARHIVDALERCRWRVHGPFGAAALLGVNPSTLRGRMRRLGIARP